MEWKVEEVLPALAGAVQTSADPAGELLDNATEAMHLLRDLIHCSACMLSSWDPLSNGHQHQTLVSDGYSKKLISFLNDRNVSEGDCFRISHARVATGPRWLDLERDWNIHVEEKVIGYQFLIPEGFHEGTTMCLRLPNGRYTGSVHVSFESAAAATDSRREILERFRPILAAACDVLRAPELLAGSLDPTAFAVVISSNGVAHDLPGRSAGPHLGEGGALRRLLQENFGSWMLPRFLWPDELGRCHKVTLAKCSGELTLVTERTSPWPFGLSLREIQVLNLIASGASNPEIAQRLFISTRTVSTHVEHILTKMECLTRSKLAAVTVAEGLLLPEANKYRNPRKLRLRNYS